MPGTAQAAIENGIQEARRVLATKQAREVLEDYARYLEDMRSTPGQLEYTGSRSETDPLDAAGGHGYVPGVAYDI